VTSFFFHFANRSTRSYDIAHHGSELDLEVAAISECSMGGVLRSANAGDDQPTRPSCRILRTADGVTVQAEPGKGEQATRPRRARTAGPLPSARTTSYSTSLRTRFSSSRTARATSDGVSSVIMLPCYRESVLAPAAAWLPHTSKTAGPRGTNRPQRALPQAWRVIAGTRSKVDDLGLRRVGVRSPYLHHGQRLLRPPFCFRAGSCRAA